MKVNTLKIRVLEKISVLLTSLYTNHRIFKFVPTHNYFVKSTTRIVSRGGIKYNLDISDYQQWLIYFNCKSDSSDHVLDYLNNSVTILDIGANIGQTSLNILKTQEKKGILPKIYSFEPFPDTFNKLQINVELNNASTKIHCINKGVGSSPGKLPMLKHNEANSGGFRIVKEANSATISVDVTTIDQFVIDNNITRVDFVKIDVEGFEFEVLKGMQQVLETHKPVVIFEFDTQNLADLNINPQDIFIYLQNLHYTFKDVNGLINFETMNTSTIHTDILCIPRNNEK